MKIKLSQFESNLPTILETSEIAEASILPAYQDMNGKEISSRIRITTKQGQILLVNGDIEEIGIDMKLTFLEYFMLCMLCGAFIGLLGGICHISILGTFIIGTPLLIILGSLRIRGKI